MKSFYWIAIVIAFMSIAHRGYAQMSISYPMDRAVFQRCEWGGSRASFYVAGQCMLGNQQYALQMKITELFATNGSTKSVYQDWTTFVSSTPFGGLFKRYVQLPGGLFNIEVRAAVGAVSYATANVRVGVGEVYLIAGQSNAQGATNTSALSQSPYEGVVSDLYFSDCSDEIPTYPSLMPIWYGYPIATQGATNWCYPKLGNNIVDQTGVPVAFFNGAQSGTHVGNWTESMYGGGTLNLNNDTQFICQKPGQPYTAFRNIMNFYGSLFGTRGVLWHQGETDSQRSTTTADYQTKLTDLINKARSDFGQPSLGWYVSKATYDYAFRNFDGHNGDPTWQDVVTAQTSVANANRQGPSTDNVGIPRADGRVHFGGTQLADLANAWSNSNITIGTPICANQMPDLEVTKNPDGSYTLTGDSSPQYTSWMWVNDNNRPVGGNVIHNGRVYSNVTSSNSYRYYAKTAEGNYVVSQRVTLPLPAGTARMAVSVLEKAENYGSQLKLSPNPVVEQLIVEHTIPDDRDVQIDVVNQQGQRVGVAVGNKQRISPGKYAVDVG